MEIEKPAAKLQEEKNAYDASGHSEQGTDINLNKAVTDPQSVTPKGIFSIFQSKKKKENILLENK